MLFRYDQRNFGQDSCIMVFSTNASNLVERVLFLMIWRQHLVRFVLLKNL